MKPIVVLVIIIRPITGVQPQNYYYCYYCYGYSR